MDSIKNILGNVFRELQTPEKKQRIELMEKWPAIAGAKLSPHTKPSLSKQGKLCVWVDQSALAFELRQKYSQTLLKRTQALLGEEAVKEIFFRVGQLR